MKIRFSFVLVLAALGFACSSPTSGGGTETEGVEPTAGQTAAAPEALPALDEDTSASAPLAPLATSLVFHTGGRPYLVLDEAPDLALAMGKPEIVSAKDEGIWSVRRGVDRERSTKVQPSTIGSHVRLRDAKGVVCEAVVEDVALVGRVSPSGEAEMRWNGEGRDGDDRPVPAPSREELADEVWDMADGGVVLAASLRPIGTCKDATYAVTNATATTAAIATADDATTARALEALRTMPEYALHAAEYLDFARDTESTQTAPRWEQHAESNPRVSVTTVAGARYVFVAAGTGAGCGDFGPSSRCSSARPTRASRRCACSTTSRRISRGSSSAKAARWSSCSRRATSAAPTSTSVASRFERSAAPADARAGGASSVVVGP